MKKIGKLFIMLLGNLFFINSTLDALDTQDTKYAKNTGCCYFDQLPNEKVYEIIGFVSDLSGDLIQIKNNHIKKLKDLILINSRFQSTVNTILNSIQDATNTYLNRSEEPIRDAINLGTIFASIWLKRRAATDYNFMIKVNEAFFRATELNKSDTVSFLIKSGANFNIQKSYQNTALTYSTGYSYKKITKLLIRAGADPNIPNKSGSTALTFATLNNNQKIVELLLKSGADPNASNRSNETPLILANNQEITDILLKFGAK